MKSITFKIRFNSIVVFCMVIAVLALYWQVTGFDFVSFDDGPYILDNQYVKNGITLKGIRWAFQFNNLDYWLPVSWLSHMLDCQFFGLNAGMHHLTSVWLHISNTILLYFIFLAMTGEKWKCMILCALFALHPFNVDSVAWIAERKNVLSTMFWMLTTLTYIYYTHTKKIGTYCLMLVFYGLGLMSKSMLMTLPYTLLLLDLWPAKRWGQTPFPSLLIEKIPLFLMSSASIVVSTLSLHQAGNVVSLQTVPLQLRIENALVSYLKYISKTIWPFKFSVFYPFPDAVPAWQYTGALIIICLITMLSLFLLKRKPYLFAGWGWYMGTLFPVIGLKQSGNWGAIADRFAYIPLIGIFFLLIWGIAEICFVFKIRPLCVKICLLILFTALMTVTWNQITHWKNSRTLFFQAVHVTQGNYIAYNNLGNAFLKEGNLNEAAEQYRKALQINPYHDKAYNNLGSVMAQAGKNEAALYNFKKALQLNPNYADAHYNMALSLTNQNNIQKAIVHYRKVLILDKSYTDAYKNLGVILLKTGKIEEALSLFKKGLEITPEDKGLFQNYQIAMQMARNARKQ